MSGLAKPEYGHFKANRSGDIMIGIYDYSNEEGRQLNDAMAYIRNTLGNIDREYALISDSDSARIAFSMSYLIKQPSAIVTFGYSEDWDREARI